MQRNTQEAVLSAYIASIGKRTPRVGAQDAAELCRLATSLNRLNEIACNSGLTERQERRKQNLQTRIKAVLDRPLSKRNVLRDGLGKIRSDMKLEDGKAFHSFRRFRTAHLRKNRVPWDLQKLWLGHANKDVNDRYAEQLKEDVEWRKQEAEKAGLGFKLPALESSIGPLGLPKQKKSKLKKVA